MVSGVMLVVILLFVAFIIIAVIIIKRIVDKVLGYLFTRSTIQKATFKCAKM